MRAIRIRTEANGYSAVEDNRFSDPLGQATEKQVRVFPTFAALVSWLALNLEDPVEAPTTLKTLIEAAAVAQVADTPTVGTVNGTPVSAAEATAPVTMVQCRGRVAGCDDTRCLALVRVTDLVRDKVLNKEPKAESKKIPVKRPAGYCPACSNAAGRDVQCGISTRTDTFPYGRPSPRLG